MNVWQDLTERLEIQAIFTTHAPLVLASLEPHFDHTQDKLFLFELVEKQVKLRELVATTQGDATDWLTSEVFDLREARSIEAEEAITAAHAWMRGDIADLPAKFVTIEAIDQELRRLLPAQDPVLLAWSVYHEKHRRTP